MPDTYSTISLIAQTGPFQERLYACAAQQNHPTPEKWGWERRWHLAATPTWAEKVDFWLAANPGGGNEWATQQDVISDPDILAAVQLALNPPPPPEEPV